MQSKFFGASKEPFIFLLVGYAAITKNIIVNFKAYLFKWEKLYLEVKKLDNMKPKEPEIIFDINEYKELTLNDSPKVIFAKTSIRNNIKILINKDPKPIKI